MDNFSWFIGILEGEGYIGLHKKGNDKPVPEIVISMSDEDVITKISDFLNCGYREVQPKGISVKGNQYKKQYRITIRGRKAYYILEKVYPYLSKRRKEKCDEVKDNYKPKTTYKTEGYVPKPKKEISLPF